MSAVPDGSTPSAPVDGLDSPPRPARSPVAAFWQGWPIRLTILGVAFLLGSFPARNDGLWAHLAAGRNVATSLHLSGLPSAPVGRLPQTWLADLIFFLTADALGGPALAVAKALFVVILGYLLLRAAGHVGNRGALLTFLTLIALGPFLQLEPVCFSFNLFAFTLLWVESISDLGTGFYRTLRQSWPLVALFAVWANLDAWFFLGPAVVFLYALGQSIRSVSGRRPARGLWFLGLWGLAACFLSPLPLHLGAAFQLPGSSAAAGTSPLQGAFWTGLLPDRIPSAAGVLLALLSALSFALNTRAGVWGRFACWAAFLAGSLVDGRLAPFFAITAGVAAARDMSDLAPRESAGPVRLPAGWLARLARGLAVAVGCALPLVAAWAGWLQPPPYDRREWRLEPEPSLERLAADRAQWRPAGATGSAFAFSPDVADLLAWFAPEVPVSPPPGTRPLKSDEVADAQAVRAAFAGDGSEFQPEAVRQIFRQRDLSHLVLFEPSKARFTAAFGRLLSMPGEWPLVYLRGRAAVFAWRDPAGSPVPTRPSVDLRRRAFDPGPGDLAPAEGPPLAGPPDWTDALLRPRPQHTLDRDEAAVYLVHQDVTRATWLDRAARSAVACETAALVLSAANGPAGVAAEGRSHLVCLGALAGGRVGPVGTGLARVAFSRFPDSSPGDPLLAVRAARRAIAEQPRDSAAALVLGEAYLRLRQGSWGRRWNALLPRLGRLRRVQAATAFHQALTLEPDLAGAHLGLAALFREEQFNDLALAHYRRYVRLTRAAGPPDALTAERLRLAESAAEALAPVVEGAQAELTAAGPGLGVYDRAKLAGSRGLAGRALDSLLGSDIAAFGPGGLFLELDLLLSTGRAREVLLWLAPEHRDLLGEADYLWIRAQAEAAAGHYRSALETLDDLAGISAPAARESAAAAIGRLTLAGLAPPVSTEKLYFGEAAQARELQRAAEAAAGLRDLADTSVLRGLVALEQGDVRAARAGLREALSIWGGPARAREHAGLDFAGRPVAQDCLGLLGD